MSLTKVTSILILSLMGFTLPMTAYVITDDYQCEYDSSVGAYYCFDPSQQIYFYYYNDGYYYYPGHRYWWNGHHGWYGYHNWWGRHGFHRWGGRWGHHGWHHGFHRGFHRGGHGGGHGGHRR